MSGAGRAARVTAVAVDVVVPRHLALRLTRANGPIAPPKYQLPEGGAA